MPSLTGGHELQWETGSTWTNHPSHLSCVKYFAVPSTYQAPTCGATAVSELEAYVVSSQKVSESKVTTLTANGKCVKIRSVIIRIVEYPLDQGSAHFFYEGSESKYFRLQTIQSLLQLLSYATVPQKQS